MRPNTSAHIAQDEGFTLIEAIVSVVLAGFLAAITGYAFMSVTKGIQGDRSQQHAVAVAETVLQRAVSYATEPDTNGCVPLLGGRNQADTLLQWSSANRAAAAPLTDMEPAFNPDTCPADVAVPRSGVLTQVSTAVAQDATSVAVRKGNTDYYVRTWIGSCWVPGTAVGVASTPCETSADALAQSTRVVKVFRVVSLVEWEGDQCATRCSYVNSAILGKTSPEPFDEDAGTRVDVSAVPTFRCVRPGTTTTLDLTQGAVGTLAANPVTVTSDPVHGALTPTGSTGSATMQYRPTAGYTGSDAVRYTLSDPAGTVSREVSLSILVDGGC